MPAFPQSGIELENFINFLVQSQPQAFPDPDIAKRRVLSDALFQSGNRTTGYTISGYWENGEWKGFQGEFSVSEGPGRYSQAGVVTMFPPPSLTPAQPSGGAPLPPTAVPSSGVTTTSMPAPPPAQPSIPLRPVVMRLPARAVSEEPSDEGSVSPMLLVGGAVLLLLYFSSKR